MASMGSGEGPPKKKIESLTFQRLTRNFADLLNEVVPFLRSANPQTREQSQARVELQSRVRRAGEAMEALEIVARKSGEEIRDEAQAAQRAYIELKQVFERAKGLW